MTAILTNPRAKMLGRPARLLLVGASGLALAAPLAANDLIFTTSEAAPVTGERTDQRSGLTQVALTGGGTVSIVDSAEYRLNADGSIDLYEGTITVASGNAGEVVVRMPEGLEGRVSGVGAAGNFTVRDTGDASGHALTGAVRIGRAGRLERLDTGAMWRARSGGDVRRVVANGAQVQPEAAVARPAGPGEVVPIGGDAGPVAAALNGLPTAFGDQLATAGASSDIVAAARRIEAVAGDPTLETFPSGDFALLVAAASRLEGAYGGQPFPEAQADVIRAYLRFLAGGGAGSSFLAAYSGFAVSYLDLIRAGGLPSGFAGAPGSAGAVDVDAWLGYIRRTGALADLAARDRVLAEAYLSFLASGGDRDRFAVGFTDLTTAYFAFVRGGGNPAAFTGATEAALARTIAFLRDSGLVVQLGAADRALVDAFLANGGLAFAAQYEAALGDYFAFLANGRLPSDYAALDQATLRAYLETLADTGLLATILGERAGFYADYLAFLRAGGEIDGFAGLPANIFAGYAAQLAAYRAFLDAGNLPSAFAATDAAQLQAFIAELQAAGALERFLGADAAFFAAFADFVRGGGSFDAFAGLNANIFAGYASALQAYFAFLEKGGVPSTYAPLSQEVIAQYLAALQAAGALARFLPELGDFYAAYFAFLSGGGNPDTFAGLPVPPDFGAFAAALNAYAAFLAGGGLPADFDGQDLAVLASFITALADAGELEARLGGNAALLSAYFAFLAEGGAPNAFTGLPIYADYVAALNAYFAFLAAGGLPSDYTVLDQATIEAYLAALAGAQGGLSGFAALNDFFADYFAFIQGGGDPNDFAQLPVNVNRPQNVLNGINGWQFARDGLRVARVDADIQEDGRITSLTVYNPSPVTTDYASRDADLREFGRIGNDVAWTRYFVGAANGQTNVSEHLLVGTPATAIPTAGTVQYALVGGTAPTDRADVAGSTAFFEGALGIAFGSSARVGVNFDVLTRDAGYRVSTAGGAADPLNGGMVVDGNGRFENQNLPITRLTATACTNFCQAQVFGGLFGEGAASAGFTYNLFDRGNGASVQGVAIFGRVGTAIDSLGTRPVAGGGTGGTGGGPTTTTRTNQNLAFANLFIGDDAVSGGSVTVDDQGRIVAYQSRDREVFQQGTTSIVESGTAAGVSWTRWADGTPVGDYYGTTSFNALGPNGGWHVIAGDALSNIPTSGTIAYNLAGWTTPTRTGEGSSTGSVSGSAAVQFGSMPRFGLDLTVTSGADQIRMATDGGVTDVSQSRLMIDAAGIFNSRATNPEILTTNIAGSFCAAGCLSFVQGFLSGDGASGAGLSYAIRQEGVSPQGFINGSAAFSKGDAIAPPPAPPPPTTGNPVSAFVLTDHIITESGRNEPLDLSSQGGNFGFVGYETNAAGEIVGFRRTFNGNLYDRIGTARNADSGRSTSGALRWTRWTEGTLEQLRLGPVTPIVLDADEGYHAIVGTPATNLPSTGRINYTLVGGTSPTSALGLAAPGQLISGAAAVEFGSTSRIGIELALEYSGQTFNAATTGGLANVAASELALGQNATFRIIGAYGNVTSSGGYCASTCRALWEGFLAGNGATEMGLTYSIQAQGGGSERLVGAAAFASAPTGTNPYAGGAGSPAVSIAPSGAPIASIDMNRWGGTGSASPQGSPVPMGGQGLSLLPPGLAAGESAGHADPHARYDAIREAERLMGGMITFPTGAAVMR